MFIAGRTFEGKIFHSALLTSSIHKNRCKMPARNWIYERGWNFRSDSQDGCVVPVMILDGILGYIFARFCICNLRWN